MPSGSVWRIEVKHEGLKKYRMVRGSDRYVVEQMAAAQNAAWNEMWAKKQNALYTQNLRQQNKSNREAMKAAAKQQTDEALNSIEAIRGLLAQTLEVNDAVDWDGLKDTAAYPINKPSQPREEDVTNAPDQHASKYIPQLGFLDKILSSRGEAKKQAAQAQYHDDLNAWKGQKAQVDKRNDDRKRIHTEAVSKWENEKAEFQRAQAEKNGHIEARKQEYFRKTVDGILDYCQLVLSRSEYPDAFPQQFELDYNPETGMLVVDYLLPHPDQLPAIKEIKYVQSRDDFDEVRISQSDATKLYDDAIYQVTLRTLHELFEADVVDAITAIVFNGWVESTDKATGKEIRPCVLTVQAGKSDFVQINLERIEPKTCFKSLKGIASPKLNSITPVAPLVKIEREDKRFVDSYGVANTLDEGTNLAAMDWEDFEHLVRELFEKEFSQAGGEVKITRASRDWGVDAVVFDPDPLRGGKIVIQAKRYANTVDVSAVRDLYGTLINEGAAKGILVTTADFGPESHEFAKGKPLTLLNGGNLLHLLAKHGHKARIDLPEARKALAAEKRDREAGRQ